MDPISADGMADLIHALGPDGVTTFRAGGGGECQRAGMIVMHSYPVEGGNGDPCACGKTRRGEPVDDDEL